MKGKQNSSHTPIETVKHKDKRTNIPTEILSGAQIVEAALKYGYSSQDNFTTAFRSFFGVTPSEIARIEGKYKRFIRTLREAYSIMEIANLKQPCYNTTLMGCLKGASDYFDNDLSAAMLFGLSGHAFMLNIHKELCPSGPYVWRKDRFFELLEGLGIRKVAQYEITKEADAGERVRIEGRLKDHMEGGDLFMIDFLEHQLASGFDEHGFLMLKPWNDDAPSQIPSLTFGSWQECFSKEGWACFTVISRSPSRKGIREAAPSPPSSLTSSPSWWTAPNSCVESSRRRTRPLPSPWTARGGKISRTRRRRGSLPKHAGMSMRRASGSCWDPARCAEPSPLMRAGMDPARLRERFGGHVFCASNAITASVRWENYVAMVNEYRALFGIPAFGG